MRRSITTLIAASTFFAFVGPASADGPKKSKLLSPGDRAPQFRLRALDGAMVRLDELAYSGKEKSYAKKKPVFVDFFRTDCEPCVKALPELVKLHEKYASRGLYVLLISILEEDDGRGKLDRFLAKTKVPFPVAVDASGHFAKKYLGDPVTLPATFLISREGELMKVKYGAKETLESYFGARIEEVLEQPGK